MAYEREFVESFVIVFLDIALKGNDRAATMVMKQLQVITRVAKPPDLTRSLLVLKLFS
jgi:hypothetical protein